jgi:histidinol-phosphate aminotransferase
MNIQQQDTSFRKLYAFGKKLPIDLSLSENPLGCSPRVSMVLKDLSQSDFFNYPDPDCNRLRKVIASRFQIEIGNIFVSNGSEAIIKLLPQVMLERDDEVIIPALTFPMFEIASKLSGGKVIISKMAIDLGIDLTDIKAKITSNTKLIFLCNPNNPTGKIISRMDIIRFTRATQAVVVVDEANIEFGGESVVKVTSKLDNLVALRTFSKGFGLAGFRIGFCVASTRIIKLLQKTSQPFPVSSVAEKVALTAFEDMEFIQKSKEFMKGERNFLTHELTKRGLKVIGSQANNLLVISPNSSSLFVRKLKNKDVSVVGGASFSIKGINFIRVSPRLRTTNEKFIQVIDEIL